MLPERYYALTFEKYRWVVANQEICILVIKCWPKSNRLMLDFHEFQSKCDKIESFAKQRQNLGWRDNLSICVEVNLWKKVKISNFVFPKDFQKMFPKWFPNSTFPKLWNISKMASEKFRIAHFELISSHGWLEMLIWLVIYAYTL